MLVRPTSSIPLSTLWRGSVLLRSLTERYERDRGRGGEEEEEERTIGRGGEEEQNAREGGRGAGGGRRWRAGRERERGES